MVDTAHEYPYGASPLAPIDRDSWHSYTQSFLPNHEEWIHRFVHNEYWECQQLLVNRDRGRMWVKGHRQWMFQSDYPDQVLYRFSGLEFVPQPYSPTAQDFVNVVRGGLAARGLDWFEFNSVLMYLYESKDNYCRLHRENEPELGDCPVVGYLGLGARREFVWSAETSFMHGLRQDAYSITFDHGKGDLMITGGLTQHRWRHAVPPPTKEMEGTRIGILLLNIEPDFHKKGERVYSGVQNGVESGVDVTNGW